MSTFKTAVLTTLIAIGAAVFVKRKGNPFGSWDEYAGRSHLDEMEILETVTRKDVILREQGDLVNITLPHSFADAISFSLEVEVTKDGGYGVGHCPSQIGEYPSSETSGIMIGGNHCSRRVKIDISDGSSYEEVMFSQRVPVCNSIARCTRMLWFQRVYSGTKITLKSNGHRVGSIFSRMSTESAQRESKSLVFGVTSSNWEFDGELHLLNLVIHRGKEPFLFDELRWMYKTFRKVERFFEQTWAIMISFFGFVKFVQTLYRYRDQLLDWLTSKFLHLK